MNKLFTLSALLLTAYSAATLMGCGGSTEAVAADASGGGAGVAGGPNGPPNTSKAGSDSGTGIIGIGTGEAGSDSGTGTATTGSGTTGSGTTSGEAGADSGIGPIGNPGAPIKCGDKTCDGAIEYCSADLGGLPLPDGGIVPDAFVCEPLPSKCLATPTCTCLAIPQGACTCTETDGLSVGCYSM